MIPANQTHITLPLRLSSQFVNPVRPHLLQHHINIFIIILSILTISCGDKDLKQTSSSSPEGTTINNQPGTVIILPVTQGMNGESTVQVKQNSFPDGTSVSAEGVSSPSEFPNTSNSGALRISAIKDGVTLDVSLQPMTIAIPENASPSLKLVNKKDLCVFLLDTKSKLYVWRKSDFISINSDSNINSFQTTRLGTYQLSRCGIENIENFKDAKSLGYTGAQSLAERIASGAELTCDGETKNVFEIYALVPTCSKHLTAFKSCTCETVEGLTQDDCTTRIANTIKSSVCVDSKFEITEEQTSIWDKGCNDLLKTLTSGYSEICTF